MRKIYGKEVRHKGGAEKVILKEVKEALDKAPAPVKELVGKVESVGKDMREAINEASARNFLVENLPGLRSLVERSDGDEEGLRRRRRVASNGDTDVSRPSTPSPEATAGNSPVSSPVRSPELLDISKIRRSASGRFAGLADLLPAKLIKEVLPPDIAGAFVPDEQLLPADLESSPYTLTVKPPAYGASFVLGEPIQIEFAAPTRTVTRKDWVGIYRVGENVREKWTNRRSQNRWKWVTDTFEPLNEDGATASGKDETQPSPTTAAAAASAGSASGSPLDKVWYSDELEEEMCGGTLHFEKSRVPWAEGLYEARYHYQGAYSVIVTSAPFEIRGEFFLCR